MKPVLFVTGHAPPDRVGAFAALHEGEHVHFALFGGRAAHGPPAEPTDDADHPFPWSAVSQRDVFRLAASGSYRAVICGTGGRVALPGAWWGARRARVPFVLWSSLWAHPLSPTHAVSYPLMLRMYASADAVVTYGSHVSAYVSARGARNVHVAPQAVDNDFWSAPVVTGAELTAPDEPAPAPAPSEPAPAPAPGEPAAAPDEPAPVPFTALFVGRPAPGKGLAVLARAWRAAGLGGGGEVLLVAGTDSGDLARILGDRLGSRRGDHPAHRRADLPGDHPGRRPAQGMTALGIRSPTQLRNLYATADVLIMPSIRTRTFREPWGLVANEAFNQRLAIIATDEVGAAAGGLIRHERNGLIVRAGNEADLAAAILRLRDDPDLRARLGAAGARDVAAFTYKAWAAGFAAALRSVSASREPW